MDDPRPPAPPTPNGPGNPAPHTGSDTRRSIDELADLYLTGISTPRNQDPRHQAVSTNDPLEGPAPIRLAPKPAMQGGVGSAVLDAQPMLAQRARADAAQDSGNSQSHPILRLTDGDDEDTPAPPRVARADARAVVLGNLPGLSGPWLTQYAQVLAQTRGSVVVLHVDEETIDLELVEPRAQAEPATTQTVRVTVPATEAGSGLVGLLDALTKMDVAPVQTVLLRLVAEAEPMAVSRLSALDDWTVLTGSDDAAVVACYRMLKRVVEHDPRNADKRVGLMVMGSDEDAARRAAGKVSDTASSFLSTPVELVGQLRQMQPVTVRQLGSFADPVALWPELVSWLEALEPAAIEAANQERNQATNQAIESPAEASPMGAAATQEREMTQPMEPVIAPNLRIPPPRSGASASAPPSPAPGAPGAPGPVRTAQTVRDTPEPTASEPRKLDLFAMLAQGPSAIVDGLALDARIPASPDIQLAVDAHGAIHLLVHHDLADDPRRSVPELVEARRWVEENLSLLKLTRRDCDFADPKVFAPVLHLFTDRAEQATTLVARLGDALKLHLLQKVTLGRETGWFCTPLN